MANDKELKEFDESVKEVLSKDKTVNIICDGKHENWADLIGYLMEEYGVDTNIVDIDGIRYRVVLEIERVALVKLAAPKASKSWIKSEKNQHNAEYYKNWWLSRLNEMNMPLHDPATRPPQDEKLNNMFYTDID